MVYLIRHLRKNGDFHLAPLSGLRLRGGTLSASSLEYVWSEPRPKKKKEDFLQYLFFPMEPKTLFIGIFGEEGHRPRPRRPRWCRTVFLGPEVALYTCRIPF